MLIDGKKIASSLEKSVLKEFKKLKNKKITPKLITFLIGQAKEQLSFVKIKERTARRLGVKFEFICLKSTPSFQDLAQKIKAKSNSADTTGIIIQQPLPSHLQTDSIYDFIANNVEIEGHKKKSPFFSPLGLAVLTIFKYIFSNQKISHKLLVNIKEDSAFFKRVFKNKRVVLIGRGVTGGKPIGQALTQAKINYLSINSSTPNPEEYYKKADVIISAVGKKVIFPDMLKPGVILINVGLRHENGLLKGDYDEKEIKGIASFYTPTPGGVGPLDVLYLYKNLLDSALIQNIRD